MSLRPPSHVSATTGSDQSNCWPLRTCQAITASRTTPTLCVLVIITGPPRNPDSSIQVVPVISPLPFNVNQPAKTASPECLPRGRIAVTPVRTGPCPTTSRPTPETSVTWPTSTPATSVMAFSGPGVPVNGTPRSRARDFAWAAREAGTAANSRSKTVRRVITRIPLVARSGLEESAGGIEHLAQDPQLHRGRRRQLHEGGAGFQIPAHTGPDVLGSDAGVDGDEG